MNTLRQLQNFCIPWVATIVLACCSNAVAQTSYQVTDLGIPLNDGNLACAMDLNNQGWTLIMDANMVPGQQDNIFGKLLSGHAVVDINGLKVDLGTLGGSNTWMNWGGINDQGQAVGKSETSVLDPDGEDVCQFGTHLTCRPFLWQNGHISALPTLGGNNGQASAINNHGQIAGTADTPATDPGCPPFHISLPVLWEDGKAQALPTVGGDPDGFAFDINEQGQVAGQSANCTQTITHAVLWENGTAILLPDLGMGAVAQGINHQGQIVGTVVSADNTTQFGALWQNGALTNLGLLPGDFGGIASGINNRGQVVGSNFDSGFNWLHAFIWRDGVMTDLGTLFPADSNLLPTMANKINDRGQISGMATVLSGPHTGDIHAFLATPVNASIGKSVADVAREHPKSNLPANVAKQLLQRFIHGPFRQ